MTNAASDMELLRNARMPEPRWLAIIEDVAKRRGVPDWHCYDAKSDLPNSHPLDEAAFAETCFLLRAAGYTQARIGQVLGGWSGATVARASEAHARTIPGLTVMRMFRAGFDTAGIASVLRRTEADVYNELARARG